MVTLHPCRRETCLSSLRKLICKICVCNLFEKFMKILKTKVIKHQKGLSSVQYNVKFNRLTDLRVSCLINTSFIFVSFMAYFSLFFFILDYKMSNCNIQVPKNALSLSGMLTPYVLSSTAGDLCTMTDPNSQAFVEITILDLIKGTFYTYRPLVIDVGTSPLIPPTTFTLPTSYSAGIWFGFNGNVLTLKDGNTTNPGVDLAAAKCVNGVTTSGVLSQFGQFAYCNAVSFFNNVRIALNNGLIQVPAIQKASDGKNCPTTRDFMVVDMDQR